MTENKISCEICLDQCSKYFYDESFDLFLVYFEGNIDEAIKKIDYACLLYISSRIGYILVKKGRIQELVNTTPQIIRTIRQHIFTLSELSPIEAGNISKITTNPNLGLQGSGVIVAIIDTGIDYLNKEFQYEDGTTRIVSIWDQTIEQGPNPEGLYYGAEYSREEINKAIKLGENKGDPKTIVPSVDEIGHGTACAGIIGATGINKELQSAAPKCEFIVVKLKEAKNNIIEEWGVERKGHHIYASTDIMTAIDYIINKINKLIKPVVIFIPLGTNCGSHDATDVSDNIIDMYSLKRGVVFVTGLGNEGISETHTSGQFEKSGEVRIIELKIGQNQKSIVAQLWIKKPDKVSIAVISPSGETSNKIPAKVEGVTKVNFVFEGTSGTVSFKVPEENSGDELIEVDLRKLVAGIWLLQLYGDYIVDGRFDGWIMQRQLLEPETKFLNSDTLITLTGPSTARLIITCSYYNQNNNSIVAESGRGYTRDGRIKPDVDCGGVNVITTAVGGGLTTITGSSIATAVLAGTVALMLQWGIVQGKDPKMFAVKIKDYLIRGTKKRSGDIYPNPQLGYGLLDLVEVFNQIRPSVRGKEWEKEVLIKIPSEIKDFINTVGSGNIDK